MRQLPPLIDFVQVKPILSTFDEIPELPSDSAPIRKFIRKANWDFIGYHCDHRIMNQQCDHVIKNISDLHKHEDFETYTTFIRSTAIYISDVIDLDRTDERYDESCSSYSDYPATYTVSKVVAALLHLNAKITEYNSKTTCNCSRCESTSRKYEYALKIINNMRSEYASSMPTSIDPSSHPLLPFMDRVFGSRTDKFKLSEAVTLYKTETGITINQSEFELILVSSGVWKVTNSHNVKWVRHL